MGGAPREVWVLGAGGDEGLVRGGPWAGPEPLPPWTQRWDHTGPPHTPPGHQPQASLGGQMSQETVLA